MKVILFLLDMALAWQSKPPSPFPPMTTASAMINHLLSDQNFFSTDDVPTIPGIVSHDLWQSKRKAARATATTAPISTGVDKIKL